MDGPVPELAERARAAAERLLVADRVLVASHIDADGLTSGAVAARMLERADLPHEVVFEKQLDEAAIERIAGTDYDVVLFTDFGSGQLEAIADHEAAGDFTPIVADHHQPADADTEFHLNPLLVGLDGASELSGAGTTYVLARALAEAGDGTADGRTAADGGVAADGADPANRDLAALAVVGAVGDMQASGGELVGANRGIVEEGVAAGVLEEGTDLAMYGKQTRPLPKLLEYASEFGIPGISGDEAGAVRFLEDLGVDLRAGEGAEGPDGPDPGEWRRWVDLTDDERRTVASALVRRAVSRGVPAEKVNRLVGTTYVLAGEAPGTELRDASEFSTLLNATARYERADVGLAVCLGDRGAAYDRASTLLANHRRNLSEGIALVEREGVERAEHLQWFHADDRIRETIVGIVAGMAMGADGIDRDRPIVAFATKDDDHVKVSARATPSLVRRGVDLSAVMAGAAAAVGGEGGGHDIAAGATIPAGEEEGFVAAADEVLGDQFG